MHNLLKCNHISTYCITILFIPLTMLTWRSLHVDQLYLFKQLHRIVLYDPVVVNLTIPLWVDTDYFGFH